MALVAGIGAGAVGWWLGKPDFRLPDVSRQAEPGEPSPQSLPGAEKQVDPRIQALEAQLMQNPEDMEALLSMGDLYVQRREYAKARGYYLRAGQVDPENLEARTHLGTVAYFLGDVDEALHHYEQVLALDPDYTVALFEMGAVLRYGRSDLPAAIKTWEHFLKLDPDAEESDRIRELVAEAKQMIADGTAPTPIVTAEANPEAPADPDAAPWPGEELPEQ